MLSCPSSAPLGSALNVPMRVYATYPVPRHGFSEAMQTFCIPETPPSSYRMRVPRAQGR